MVAVLTMMLTIGMAGCQSKQTANESDEEEESQVFDVEIPECETFVVANADEEPVYRTASAESPQLMVAIEDAESDMVDMMFRWSDEEKPEGYNQYPFQLMKEEVVPVVAEEGDWYRVRVGSDLTGTTEAYIEKSRCHEVKPEPITTKVLKRIGKGTTRKDKVITEGELKGLCATVKMGWMDEPEFSLGELRDGVLLYPETEIVYAQYVYGTKEVNFEQYEQSFVVQFGEKHSNDQLEGNLDVDCLSDELMEDLLEAVRKDNPQYVKVYYYFPSVRKDDLYGFTFELK